MNSFIEEIKPGIWEHYKKKRYRVIGVAKHSETLEDLVVYQALYNNPEFGDKVIWVRPKSMFLETVELNGKTIPRFKRLS